MRRLAILAAAACCAVLPVFAQETPGEAAKAPPAGLLALPSVLDLDAPPPEAAPAAPEQAAKAPAPGKPSLSDDRPVIPIARIPNHRQLMRDILIELADYAHKRQPGFVVLARGGLELLVKGEREVRWEALSDLKAWEAGELDPRGTVVRPYLRVLDGVVIDGLYCGDRKQAKTRRWYADMLAKAHRRVVVIDHCGKSAAKAEAAAAKDGALLFASPEAAGKLGSIPVARPPQENADNVTALAEARTLLAVLDPDAFPTRRDWVLALAGTNHDLLVVDVFHRGTALTADEVKSLKYKKLGTRRLVLAAMLVGIARDDAFYWRKEWRLGSPPWIAERVKDRPGHYVVEYWADDWKKILGKYLAGIMDLGFDGVVLDAIGTYAVFEDLMPLPDDELPDVQGSR